MLVQPGSQGKPDDVMHLRASLSGLQPLQKNRHALWEITLDQIRAERDKQGQLFDVIYYCCHWGTMIPLFAVACQTNL